MHVTELGGDTSRQVQRKPRLPLIEDWAKLPQKAIPEVGVSLFCRRHSLLAQLRHPEKRQLTFNELHTHGRYDTARSLCAYTEYLGNPMFGQTKTDNSGHLIRDAAYGIAAIPTNTHISTY